MSRDEKITPSPNGKTDEALEEIREMLVGPPVRKLERQIADLSQQLQQLVEQIMAERGRDEKKWEYLQAELAENRKKNVRRAARHRALTTTKIKKLAQQLDGLTEWLEAEQQNRLELAETVAALSKRRRAAPRVYKIRKTAVADYRARERRLSARGKKK